jgi:hypothetical protein
VHRARKIRSRAALEFLETNATTKVFGHWPRPCARHGHPWKRASRPHPRTSCPASCTNPSTVRVATWKTA